MRERGGSEASHCFRCRARRRFFCHSWSSTSRNWRRITASSTRRVLTSARAIRRCCAPACRKSGIAMDWNPAPWITGRSCGMARSRPPCFRYSKTWMDLAAFDYHLPEELIAQEPLADRAASRMLVLHRREHRWEDRAFRDLPSYLGAGDCLVLNDSRVFPARLFGQRVGVHSLPIGHNNPKRREYLSGAVEVLLLRAVSADGKEWEALVRPGRKMRTGERIRFPDGLEGEIIARAEFGERTIRFHTDADLFAAFEKIGHIP